MDSTETMSTTVIRRLRSSEAGGLVPLVTTAGHPATAEQLEARIERILADPAYETWVAAENGALIGVAAATIRWTLESDAPVVHLIALVTHPEHRRRGIAGALIGEVERWALDHRAGSITVIGGALPKGLRRFLGERGFTPTGTRLERWL